MTDLNLYILTRNQDEETYMKHENVLSNRNEIQKIKKYEFQTVVSLVNMLEESVTIKDLDGFYFSYTIQQIGKEFDLLKIHNKEKVLNIELKSQDISEEEIKDQLIKNRYYLEHIAGQLYLFTFVEKTQKIYQLKEENLEICDLQELINIIKNFDEFETGDINKLFLPNQFLISPLNTSDKFLEGKYFLTNQQREIKKEIMKGINENSLGKVWGITGSAGTGKTLLLYDIAKECSEYGRCCIIHSGILCKGHCVLNDSLENIDIIAVKDMNYEKIKLYKYIFVDESQRLYTNNFGQLLKVIDEKNNFIILSYDYFQTLTYSEKNNNIPEQLRMIDGFQEKKLSNKIRTNTEMASFIRNLLNLKDKSQIPYRYKNIEVIFAKSVSEAIDIIRYYRINKQYIFIEYTKSMYYRNSIDYYNGDINTHRVIGQEFDNVLVVMDNNFSYGSDGRLCSKEHPNPKYIFYKLFFQAVSRAKERLCILVVGNQELFNSIIDIKYKNINGSK